MKKILFVANRGLLVMDDPAFTRSIALAEKAKAQITVLSVLSESDVPGFDTLNEPTVTTIEKDFVEQALVFTRQQIPLKFQNKTDVKVRIGLPFFEIIKESIEGRFDLIVKSRELQQQTLSSLDLHLMRKSQVPVYIDYKSHEMAVKNITCAIDLRLEQSSDGQALNDKIMLVADRLATLLDLEISIISCWEISGEAYLHQTPLMDTDNLDLANLSSLEAAKNRELMKAFITRCGTYKHHLIKGDAGLIIPQFVQVNRPQVLIMGGLTHTDVPGYLIGNTAENIALNTYSGLVIVKPDNFISPVLK